MALEQKILEGIRERNHVERLLEEYGTGNPQDPKRLVPLTQELGQIVSPNNDPAFFENSNPFGVRRVVGDYLAINPEIQAAEEALKKNKGEIYTEYHKFLNERLKDARRDIEEGLRDKIGAKNFDSLPKRERDSLIRAELIEYLYLLIRGVVGEDFRRKLDLSGDEQQRREQYHDEVVKHYPWLRNAKAFMPIRSGVYRRLLLADILKGIEEVDKDKLEDKLDEATSYKRMAEVVYADMYITEDEKVRRVKGAFKDEDDFEDKLRDLYVEEGMEKYEIAAHLGVKIDTVKKWLERYDITRETKLKRVA